MFHWIPLKIFQMPAYGSNIPISELSQKFRDSVEEIREIRNNFIAKIPADLSFQLLRSLFWRPLLES